MIQVNRIYLIFNRLVTKKFLVDTSDVEVKSLLVAILGISDDRNKKKESYFQKNMQITMEKTLQPAYKSGEAGIIS